MRQPRPEGGEEGRLSGETATMICSVSLGTFGRLNAANGHFLLHRSSSTFTASCTKRWLKPRGRGNHRWRRLSDCPAARFCNFASQVQTAFVFIVALQLLQRQGRHTIDNDNGNSIDTWRCKDMADDVVRRVPACGCWLRKRTSEQSCSGVTISQRATVLGEQIHKFHFTLKCWHILECANILK